jgi:phosphinothricin acetyltransferase
MDVRDATGADLPAILDIYNQAVLRSTATADLEPQTLEVRRGWMRDRLADGLPVIVAESGGDILGWAALSRYNPRPGYRFTVENSVYVHHEQRGRGVGRVLLDELVARARGLGMRAILAKIDSGNDASLKLHGRAGFVKVGQLPGVIYKFDQWLDVSILQLHI